MKDLVVLWLKIIYNTFNCVSAGIVYVSALLSFGIMPIGFLMLGVTLLVHADQSNFWWGIFIIIVTVWGLIVALASENEGLNPSYGNWSVNNVFLLSLEKGGAIFRKGSSGEYARWLEGYRQKGKEPEPWMNPRSSDSFLVARRDFKLNGECGSSSREIIVPKGVKFLGGELGHNDLFFMEDFTLTER